MVAVTWRDFGKKLWRGYWYFSICVMALVYPLFVFLSALWAGANVVEGDPLWAIFWSVFFFLYIWLTYVTWTELRKFWRKIRE